MSLDAHLRRYASFYGRTDLVACDHCEGTGSAWRPRTYGNDPEGRVETCPECDGRGEVEIIADDEAVLQ